MIMYCGVNQSFHFRFRVYMTKNPLAAKRFAKWFNGVLIRAVCGDCYIYL